MTRHVFSEGDCPREALFYAASDVLAKAGQLLIEKIGEGPNYFAEPDQEAALEQIQNEMASTFYDEAREADELISARQLMGELHDVPNFAQMIEEAKFRRVILGLFFLGIGGPASREWHQRAQVHADIEDMIALRFRKVNGFWLDYILPAKLGLNTSVSGDRIMRVVTLTPEDKTTIVRYQRNETGRVEGQTPLKAMFGSPQKQEQFFNRITSRLVDVRRFLEESLRTA